MSLREKIDQKVKSFFEKTAIMHKGEEFEIALSEVQRETGTTSATVKRAIEALEAEDYFEVNPGRNSRYRRFKLKIPLDIPESEPSLEINLEPANTASTKAAEEELNSDNHESDLKELENQVESLRKRSRTQEMTIALLQERVAEIEDKLFKK